MKKLSLIIIALLVVLVCCKKTPQVNIQYVDVEREVLTIGTTTANIQCDYEYIATLKSAKLYYGRTEDNMNYVTMRVVQSVLYAEIDGLSSNTTYRYYYEFENGFNSMQSEVKTFVTESIPVSLPTVITADVSEIAANSAVCGGEVTDNGGGNVTARGVCWSTSANPTISDSHSTDGSGLGTFTSNMTGLSSNTTYHVRAYAINEAGTAYGLEKTFTTLPDGGTIELPVVVTSEVVSITAHGASCGGEVISDGGAEVTERGICWSTNANPTISDTHVTSGNGTGSYTASMTGLSSNTTYHVRAYATNEAGTAYGLDRTFTTLNGGGGGDHEWVDLNLPSGTLWATCNVGANSPEEYGDYFAWGETQPKTSYGWNTYIYCNGDSDKLTKYCSNFLYGYNGFTDSLTVLLPEDDAATVNWGADWCMPSESQMMELINSTTVTWTSLNGVIGFLFTADNGNSLFLPAAGQIHLNPSNPYLDGRCCYYRTNALYVTLPEDTWILDAYIREDLSFTIYVGYDGRNYGESVRPVRTTPIYK